MSRNTRAMARFLCAAAAVIVAAPAASAGHGDIHPTFKTTSAYFHCGEPTKVGQVNSFSLVGRGSPWDASPPTQSLTAGGGCVAGDWSPSGGPAYDAAFRGRFTGNLRDLTVRLHEFLVGGVRGAASETIRLEGSIDGTPIFPFGYTANVGRTLQVAPVTTGTHSRLYEFSITNLGFANEVVRDDGSVDVERGGVALEDGYGEGEHELTLFVGLHGAFTLGDPTSMKVTTWAWDATEVPGGITFNPPALAKATVAADLPKYDSGGEE